MFLRLDPQCEYRGQMTQDKVKAHSIAQAFRGGRWLRGYVRGKITGDPVFGAASEMIGQRLGPVVDLGCGLGLLGLWLGACGISNGYRGCDLGGWKIEAGRLAACRLGSTDMLLEQADMLQFPLEGARTICAFDVMHYLPLAQQEVFIQRLARATNSGALVLMRTGVRGCGWRTGATLLEEWWTRASGWIQGGQVAFPSLKDLHAAFERGGCRVVSRPLWGRTPFSSHWLEVSARH
jgi:hypothetical protein